MRKSVAPSSQERPRPEGSAAVEAGPRRGPGEGNAARAERLGVNLPWREEMEAAFGEDFSDVRVVVRPGALDAMGAEAAQEGDTLVLPTARPDRETVAHELTHLVQRRRHGTAAGGKEVSDTDDAAEHEAERAAKAAARGAKAAVTRQASAATMRKAKWAKEDKYNRGGVKDNEPGGHVERQRPGVTLGSGAAKDDTFGIASDTTVYYGNGEPRTTLKRGADVCVNPAKPRTLDGHVCVLVWNETKGAGWVPADAIDRGDDLKAKLFGPTYESERPSSHNLANATAEYRFKVNGPTLHSSLGAGVGSRVKPNQKSDHANKVSDHLLRSGGTTTDTDDYYNIFMNLPQADAAAVAHDVAQPGETFFVVKNEGSLMKRSVATYDKGSSKAKKDITFVYGYGERNGAPDPERRGWVVYDVLYRP